MRQILDELTVHKSDIIHEMIQIYTSISSQSRLEEDMARLKVNAEEILRRKDKLLDLNIDGRISDQEFTLRNDRFNRELEEIQQHLTQLEAEKLRNRDLMQSIEVLRQAITKELSFADGFSVGVIDALLDHIEVEATDDKNRVKVRIYLKAVSETRNFLIQRRRENTSVCSAQYT